MEQQQIGTTERTIQGATAGTGVQEYPAGAGGQGAMQQSMPMGQQYGRTGGQTTGMGQQSGRPDMKLEDAMTDEMRVALHDFVQSATACEWCADRCIDEGPGMSECIRLCRDVADLATLNVQFISRDSIFGSRAADLFADAAEACARECAQHPHQHCQECADVLSRAAQSTRKMLTSFGATGGGSRMQGTQFQQPRTGQFQQTAGQQF